MIGNLTLPGEGWEEWERLPFEVRGWHRWRTCQRSEGRERACVTVVHRPGRESSIEVMGGPHADIHRADVLHGQDPQAVLDRCLRAVGATP